MITTRPATPADVKAFYPEMTCSFRAWVVDMDGEPSGIVGLALVRPAACLFSTVRDNLRPHLRSMPVLRVIMKVHRVMQGMRNPICAIAEPEIPEAPQTLARLGFAYVGNVDGDEIYQFGGKADG